jgi:hypothetical protein
MPQRKTEIDDYKDKDSELFRFLFEILKKHEEKMDQITNDLGDVAENFSSNLQKLSNSLDRISDKTRDLEEKIKNLKDCVQ